MFIVFSFLLIEVYCVFIYIILRFSVFNYNIFEVHNDLKSITSISLRFIVFIVCSIQSEMTEIFKAIVENGLIYDLWSVICEKVLKINIIKCYLNWCIICAGNI